MKSEAIVCTGLKDATCLHALFCRGDRDLGKRILLESERESVREEGGNEDGVASGQCSALLLHCEHLWTLYSW